MMSYKTALGLLFLAMSSVMAEFWGTGKRNHNYDISDMSELNQLYNSKVYKAELFTRPLEGLDFQYSILSHSGVRVTTEDGTKWLVHKGNDFGISSQTVVVNGNHMSSNWEFKEEKDFGGSKTVSDFVDAGGEKYSLWFDNCHNAANRMMDG